LVNYKNSLLLHRLAWLAVLLAFFVVMLGAYTRLVDAGLGCPDWPACYGHITVPESHTEIAKAEQAYPDRPVEAAKAWTEMVHRYFASSLGFLILLMSGIALWRKHRAIAAPVKLTLSLLAVVIFQGLLGMWTVTLLLQPTIVMGHLLGGLTTLSLLWLLVLSTGTYFSHTVPTPHFRIATLIGLILLAFQIFLGGWTSANYAGIACPDFPYCQGQLWPAMNWHQTLNLWPQVGPDYQGGLLPMSVRMSINTLHRALGMIVGVYFLILSVGIMLRSKQNAVRKVAIWVFFIVLSQVIIGILNVLWYLPLHLAVMHNGVAALLLVSVITLLYSLYAPHKGSKACE